MTDLLTVLFIGFWIVVVLGLVFDRHSIRMAKLKERELPPETEEVLEGIGVRLSSLDASMKRLQDQVNAVVLDDGFRR